MPFGTALLFDPETDAIVSRMWEDLSQAGVTSSMLALDYPPHITLAASEQLDVAKLTRDVQAWMRTLVRFAVTLPNLGVFPNEGVVYLGVIVTEPFRKIHEALSVSWDGAAENTWEHYAKEKWVPHCTLAHGLSTAKIREAIGISLRTPLPLIGTVDTLTIVESTATGEIIELVRHPLSGAD
jgi:2'-5' RNA ligase